MVALEVMELQLPSSLFNADEAAVGTYFSALLPGLPNLKSLTVCEGTTFEIPDAALRVLAVAYHLRLQWLACSIPPIPC